MKPITSGLKSVSNEERIYQHLARMLPQAGFPESRDGKEWTRAGRSGTTKVCITNSHRVCVLWSKRDAVAWEQLASCRINDVIVGKGHTLIGRYTVEH